MSKRKFKNGYSIVEVVIALSVIVVISIAALSTVLSSVATKQAAINKTEAQNFAENAWECFKVSDDDEKFVSNVNFAEGVTLADGVAGENGYKVYTYYSEENKFTAQISVKFPANERAEFKIDVTDKNGKSIISFSYQKGGEI